LISDAIARMQAMVGDALERSSLGIMDEALQDFPFSEIMDEVLKHFKDSIASGSLKIIVDQDFSSVRANRSRLTDAIISIVEGCIKCFERGDRPVLHIGHMMNDDGSVFFIISEDGTRHKPPGDVFSLVSGNKNPEDFAFSGLALAKRTVEAQGGRIWIESEAEAGCSVLFTLPEAEKERALR
jgi:light-regulated signal transduction histidine kinase (bacteriophytochrome)